MSSPRPRLVGAVLGAVGLCLLLGADVSLTDVPCMKCWQVFSRSSSVYISRRPSGFLRVEFCKIYKDYQFFFLSFETRRWYIVAVCLICLADMPPFTTYDFFFSFQVEAVLSGGRAAAGQMFEHFLFRSWSSFCSSRTKGWVLKLTLYIFGKYDWKKIGVHLIKIMLFSRSRMDVYFEGQRGCFQSTAWKSSQIKKFNGRFKDEERCRQGNM